MRVLSLFDGISGAAQALKELEIECEYYASEIDKFAIQISQKNHPDIKHLGCVKSVNFKDLSFDLPDLLIGGSPCQDLSIAKKGRKGLDGERSGLFYEYVRILKEVKPKFFILENVASMSKESKELISKELFDIEPIMINSSLLVAQQRKRLYWVGKLVGDKYEQVIIEQPTDQGVLLKDILESDVDSSYYINTDKGINYLEKINFKGCKTVDDKSMSLTASSHKGIGNDGCTLILEPIRVGHFGKGGQGERIYSVEGKSINLSANGGGLGAKTGLYKIDLPDGDYVVRKLTTNECCRLQGFPDDYVSSVSKTQGYKALGNSFTVPVIKHIISTIFKN